MGQMVFEPSDSWALGAQATPSPTLSPKETFSAGENTVLYFNTGQTAVIGQREGWSIQNTKAQEGKPAIIGQYEYARSTGNLTQMFQHLVVGANGRMDVLKADRTLDPADPNRATQFTSGYYPPSFVTMNNLCFIANGIDPLRVFNGTKSWAAGMVRPAAPTGTVYDGGTLPKGHYSIVLTYYDATTGLESSASNETTFEAVSDNKGVTVNWLPYTGQHPWTHTRVYIRWDEKQTEHFLVQPNGEVTAPTTTINVSLTADALTALTRIAPDSLENEPPPTGLVGIEAHVSRLFAHDGAKVYYSNLDAPEAFDPENHFTVNKDDGQKIVALHAAHEVLIIFKRDSVWALYGESPATWVPRMISPTTGCINERSIVYVEGSSYWWSERGPMSWSGAGPVENLALGRLDDQVKFEVGLSTRASAPNANWGTVGVVAALDIVNQRIIWAIPEVASTQNNLILPFKYRFNQWEATKWFGMDAASLATIQDLNSTPHIYLGGYKGQIFRYGGVLNDGTPSGLVEGQVVGPGTPNTITVDISKGPLYTVGEGLSERYLYLNDGTPQGWMIRKIASNTDQTITVEENFTTDVNAAWNWSVGTIAFKVILPWLGFSAPFIRKRLEYGYFWVGTNANASDIEVELYRDFNADRLVRYFRVDLRGEGLIWDEGKWDKALWGSGKANTRSRKRLAKVCFSYRWLFRQYRPNTDAVIFKVDTRAETQVDKK